MDDQTIEKGLSIHQETRPVSPLSKPEDALSERDKKGPVFLATAKSEQPFEASNASEARIPGRFVTMIPEKASH